MRKKVRFNDLVPINISHPINYNNFSKSAKPQVDFSYKLISNIRLNKQSIHRSIFRGTIFRDVEFDYIDLSRGDFQAARFERCTFVNCDFSVSDFKACHLGKITFLNCDFKNSSISDCKFEKVRFSECNFELSYFMNCDIIESYFENSNFSKGEHLLNFYSKTTFINMHLADCTFDKHIFTKCEFHNCKIAAVYLGMLIGIAPNDLNKMELIYQDKNSTLNEPVETVMEAINEEYLKRGMLLSAAIFRLNYGLYSSKYLAFLDIRDVVIGSLQSKLIINKEEIVFLERLLDHYYKMEKLPLLVVLDYYEKLNELRTSNLFTSYDEINKSSLNILIIKIASILHEMHSALDTILLKGFSLDKDVPLFLCITFKSKPKSNVASFINILTQKTGFTNAIKTNTIDSYSGSYIEWFQTGLYALLSLRIALFLFNGVLKQIVATIDTTELIVSKVKNKKKNQIANSFGLTMPSKIIIPTNNLYNYIKKLERNDPVFFDGIELSLIKKIEVSTNKRKLYARKKKKSAD